MKVDWAGPAVRDLDSIHAFIARESRFYADRFISRIITAAGRLSNYPDIGRVVPEAANSEIRELLFHNYRIIYRREPDRILVIAVTHTARDLAQLKSEPWDVF